MKLSFRRWRPRSLLLAWSVYWVGLIVVALRPAIWALWRMSQQTEGHGSVNAGVTDGVLSANIVEAGRTTWAGSVSVLTFALLIAIPPLVLWLVWLAGSSRTNHAEEILLKNGKTRTVLHVADPRIGIVETSSTSMRREREES